MLIVLIQDIKILSNKPKIELVNNSNVFR